MNEPLIAHCQKLSENIQENWYSLGKDLTVLRRHLPGALFTSCCKQIGFSSRTASYLMRAYQKIAFLGIAAPLDITWRKMGEVAPLLKWENCQDVLTFCRTHSREEIIQAVREKKFR